MSEGAAKRRPPFQRGSRHIFVCTGTQCAPSKSSELYAYLKRRLKELDPGSGKGRILRSQCQCLGICEGGPLAVVYPEGIWYYDLDAEKIEKILRQHLIEGNPVTEFMLTENDND